MPFLFVEEKTGIVYVLFLYIAKSWNIWKFLHVLQYSRRFLYKKIRKKETRTIVVFFKQNIL